MGFGKTLNRTKNYPNINIESHLLDSRMIKSFYILVNGKFNITHDEIYKLKSKIGKTIKNNLNKELFHVDKFIQLVEIKDNHTYIYGGYEYTIFLIKENSLTLKELEQEVIKITDVIYNTHFNNTLENEFIN